MDESTRLILALQQVENICSLTKNNEYRVFIHNKLISVKYELERQLSNLSNNGTSS